MLAGSSDGRFRYEVTYVGGDSTVDVSDGKQEWTHYSARNEYTVGKAGSDSIWLQQTDDNVLRRYCALDRSPVRDVRWLRRDTMVLEGRPLACDVMTTSAGTYWIEREQHRVVREERVFSDGSRWETEFLLVHLHQEPPQELFVSPVPADAKLLSPKERRMSPATTWAGRYEEAAKELVRARDDEERFYALREAAKAAFELGKIDEARQRAQRLLDLAPRFRQSWNYGNAIHDGHLVLGRVAVQTGDLATAARELLEAGRTPGSPQLNTNGPNMSLAKDLLERNQVEAVVEYFRLCGAFWEGELVGGRASAKLERWSRDAKAGEVPDFGISLRY
jgi:tetratricopeptide (TPR) repeat protein